MKKIIDACGLTCPAPVLLVKDAVEQAETREIAVLVDNEASRENLSRFLSSRGYSVTGGQEGEGFRIVGRRGEMIQADPDEEAAGSSGKAATKVVVIVAGDCLGAGDDVLGRKLMVNYLKTLGEMGTDLWQLIFVNGGVRLTTASSPVLRELREYQSAGVILLACGTCLEHFGLTAQKHVGGTTNMLDIVTAIHMADKVITLG